MTRDKPVRPCWKVLLHGAAGSWHLSTVRNGLSEALLKIHTGLRAKRLAIMQNIGPGSGYKQMVVDFASLLQHFMAKDHFKTPMPF